MADYSVTLAKIIEKHKLEIIFVPKPPEEIEIKSNEVNRPGIVLTGYTDSFDPTRIQILGWTEFGFLLNMSDDERRKALGYWLELHPAAAVVTRGLDIPDYLKEACIKYDVPLLRTDEETSAFLASLIAFLTVNLHLGLHATVFWLRFTVRAFLSRVRAAQERARPLSS